MRRDRDGRPIDERLQALDDVAERLRCPNCTAALSLAGNALRCANGHSFDVAREGYVALAPPRRKLAGGDSPEMVAARETFLARGHYEAIASEVARAANGPLARPTGDAPLAVELGAGTGYYLAALLSDRPTWRGVALDSSRPALRRATRSHPRVAAVLCDVWQELPICDACAEIVLNVFAPRNAAEIARVLAPGGTVVIVTPAPTHLHELVDKLGLLDVGADKQARLRAALAPGLEPVAAVELELKLELDRDDVRTLVWMGPSARHLSPAALDERIARLAPRTSVGASVVIESYRASAG
ncbi:MAG TPA: methyltransferase domain-containing protein [Solirubrobacteraceae bacterium]|nr:methyltransferase domain-containing protein [Solirubrobacteraceae bacterium]